MKFKQVKFRDILEAKETKFTLRTYDENNKLCKIETSALATVKGTLKKYAKYLSQFHFSKASLMFDYLTDDYKNSTCAYTIGLFDNDGSRIDTIKFSEFLKTYYDVDEIYDMIKYHFTDDFYHSKYLDKLKRNVKVFKNSKMFKELFGSRMQELIDAYETFNTRMKFKSLKESETYDLEFLKDVLAQCSDAQLADIYNMIVVENLNNCSLASIADSFIAGEDQIYEPFKSLFKKNGIKLDAIYMRYSTIIGTDLPPIDYERFDEYYNGESIESVLKNDLGTYYDVNVYDYGYDSLFVELEDIAIKNVWQKASGIDNLKFATSLLEDIAEDQGIDVIQNYIEENYRIKSAADITPDVIKNAIIAIVLRDLGNCLFMLSELVTFTPKALDAIKKFCKDVDDFYEYWR